MKTESLEQQNVKQAYTKPTLEEMGDLGMRTLASESNDGGDPSSVAP